MSEIPPSRAQRASQGVLLPLGLGVAAAAMIWIATPWGIGVEYDSVFYWSAAENLLAGRGLGRIDGAGQFVPLTHFPPLYPLVLAGISGLSHLSVAESARLYSAALLGLNVFLLGSGMLVLVRSTWLAVGAALVILCAPVLLERYLWLMSEPLYFALLLSSLLLLVRAVEDGATRWWLASSVAAALATITRYAGISLVATGAIACLLMGTEPLAGRLRRAVLYSLVAATLPAAWLLRNLKLVGTLGNRELLYHPPQMDRLREAGSTIASWLPYEFLSTEVRAIGVALLGAGALALLWRWLRSSSSDRSIPAGRLASVAALHAFAYLVFLGTSLMFFDASTRLRDRILSPIFLSGIIMVAGLLAMRSPRLSGILKIATVAALALLLVPYANTSWIRLGESRLKGLGFASDGWRDSETIALVRRLSGELQLYSNEAFPIYYLTGRPAFWIPERLDPVKGLERRRYQEALQAMRASVAGGEAALILFHPQSLRPELPPLEELTLGLEPTLTAEDGMIYLAAEE